MIQLTFNQILISSLLITSGLGVIQWLITKWVATRLEKSIQHEYDIKLEEHRFQQLQRQKAESIARLFARWIKYRGKENKILSKSEQFDYYEDLNRMSIEVALWIGDENLIKDVMARFENNPEAKSIHDLIGEVRRLILNKKDNFDSNKVVIWPTKELLDELLKNN